MKTLFTLVGTLLISVSSIGQNQFGYGATWYFGYDEYGYVGYKKVEYVKDTNMLNMVWQKFDVSGIKQIQTGPSNNDVSTDTNAQFDPIFIATRNDSVFRLKDTVPYLLYDFSADVGDSWQFEDLDTTFGCTDVPVATVLAKGSMMNNGNQLNFIDLGFPMDTLFDLNGDKYYGHSSGWVLTSRIFQDFGEMYYSGLFTPYPNPCNGVVVLPNLDNVRCFFQGPLYINIIGKKCDSWPLSEEELENEAFLFYPNPADGSFQIELSASHGYNACTLIDMTGRVVLKNSFDTDQMNVEIQFDVPGVYTLILSGVDGHDSVPQRIVIQ